MKPNRSKLIRLAHANPELRPALIPLIKKMAGTQLDATIDFDIAPEPGMLLTVLDSGDPFDGDTDEVLHQIETNDGLGEGHLILHVADSPLRRGDTVEVLSSHARPSGGDFAGKVRVRKV